MLPLYRDAPSKATSLLQAWADCFAAFHFDEIILTYEKIAEMSIFADMQMAPSGKLYQDARRRLKQRSQACVKDEHVPFSTYKIKRSPKDVQE